MSNVVSSAELQQLVDLEHNLICLTATLLALAYVAVGLRLWVRLGLVKGSGWDDAAIVVALVWFSCYSGLLIAGTDRALVGIYVSPRELFLTVTYLQVAQVSYILSTAFLKISLGLFFLRVLIQRWQTILFRVVIVISVVSGLAMLCIVLFQCGSPARLGLTATTQQNCLSSTFLTAAQYIFGTINILADWLFVLIPITVIMDSQLGPRTKTYVIIVMACGAIGSVSSIMRMVYLIRTKQTHDSGFSVSAIQVSIWTTMEPGTGIIAASVATLRSLIRKAHHHLFSTLTRGGTKEQSQQAAIPNSRRRLSRRDPDAIALTSVSGDAIDTVDYTYPPRGSDPWNEGISVGHEKSGNAITVDKGFTVEKIHAHGDGV